MGLVRAHAQHSSCKRRRLFLALEGVAAGVAPGNNNTMVQTTVLMIAAAMEPPSLVTMWTQLRVAGSYLVALERMHERENGKLVSQNAKGLDLDCKQNRTAMDIVQVMVQVV